MYDLEGLRAISLLRVSSKKQATKKENNEIDIPEQRKIIAEFMNKNKVVLVKEFIEGGVSGFKLKPDERDALRTIKALALDKKFDILIVYASDRIGRIADESPAVIRFLNDLGIRVWSYMEGEIKTNTHIDKLITYIQFWRNEEDSLKISKRSTDYHIQMIEDGKYRGGSEPPYGYKLVDNGRTNHKGRKIFDLEINENEFQIAVLIYELSIDYNMGSRRIAKYLNDKEIPSRHNNQWNYSSINYMFHNPVYKGYLHMYSELYDENYKSKQIEKLIIISEDRWNLNQIRIKGRTNKHNNTRSQSIPTSSRVLLSGLVYCGYCDSKMGVWANHKHYRNAKGEMIKAIYDTYKCRSKIYIKDKKCEGQTTYSAKNIDEDVENQVKDFIINISKSQLSKTFKKQLDNNIKDIETDIRKKSQQMTDIVEEIKILRNEIPKSLLGKSKFNEDLLQDLLEEKNTELLNIQKNIENLNLELKDTIQMRNQQIKTNKDLKNWNELYDNASLDKKKILISEVVDKVYLFKDKIKIVFKINSELYESYGSVKD